MPRPNVTVTYNISAMPLPFSYSKYAPEHIRQLENALHKIIIIIIIIIVTIINAKQHDPSIHDENF